MVATHPSPVASAVIDDVAAAVLAFGPLASGGIERAAVLFLDPERRLLGRAHFVGEVGMVAPRLRDVIVGALAHDAAALILGHGHPSGDPTPSPADFAYTRALARLCAAVDVALLDHLIVAGPRVASLRRLGLL